MLDNQEKITLTAAIEALTAQVKSQQELDNLEPAALEEYNSLVEDINNKHAQAISDADAEESAAITEADTIRANAIAAANEVRKEKVEQINLKKEELLTQASTYLGELRASNAATIDRQRVIADELAKKQARLAEINEEEARLKREEAARIAAEAQRRVVTSASRPKIQF